MHRPLVIPFHQTSIHSGSTRPGRAFTLIELLVVVAIIAVLMAILLPSLNAARAQSKQSVCASNARQLAVALNVYAGEYSGVLCNAALTYVGTTEKISWNYYIDKNGKCTFEGAFLAPYLGGPKILYCPETTNYQYNSSDMNARVLAKVANTSYAMSLTGASKISMMTSTGLTAAFADSLRINNDGTWEQQYQLWRPSQDDQNTFHGRHRNGVGNVSFYDGHVESVTAVLPAQSVTTGPTVTQNAYSQMAAVKLGRLCYGKVDPAKITNSADFIEYAHSQLDYYFWPDKDGPKH